MATKRKRYNKGNRVDMRTGGRVGFKQGGPKNPFDPNTGQPTRNSNTSSNVENTNPYSLSPEQLANLQSLLSSGNYTGAAGKAGATGATGAAGKAGATGAAGAAGKAGAAGVRGERGYTGAAGKAGATGAAGKAGATGARGERGERGAAGATYDDAAIRAMIQKNQAAIDQGKFDPSSLQEQIEALKNRPNFDSSAIEEQLTALKNRPDFDSSAIEEQLAALQNRPQFDATILEKQIAALQNKPGFDASGIQAELALLKNKPGFDPTNIEEQLSALQNKPGFDASGLKAMIEANKAAIDAAGQQGGSYDEEAINKQIQDAIAAAGQQGGGYDQEAINKQIQDAVAASAAAGQTNWEDRYAQSQKGWEDKYAQSQSQYAQLAEQLKQLKANYPIGKNEDTVGVETGDPKGTEEGTGDRQGGPWWRRNGYNSQEEALADGWQYVNGQWTQSSTDNEEEEEDGEGYEIGDTYTDDDGVTYVLNDLGPPPVWEVQSSNNDGAGDGDGDGDGGGTMGREWIPGTPEYAERTQAQSAESRELVQAAAEGTVPAAGVIPKAEQLDSGDYTQEFIDANKGSISTNENGHTANQIRDMIVGKIPMPEGINYGMPDAQKLQAKDASLVGQPDPNSIYKEAVTEGTSTAVDSPLYKRDGDGNVLLDDEGNPVPAIETAEYDEDLITSAEATEAGVAPTAQTIEELSVGATADMQSKALRFSAEGVSVDQEQAGQALADQISQEWSLDDKAKVDKAAEVAGLNLPRVLRAKKQLRKAGLTEDQINLIGNDPELLEDELMNYSEAERGMIAGLPEEALVSTQMNNLLEGMESGEIPAFARPAVAAVNQMLAERGLSASTVGRDALFNSIIQSAMPLAQSNAQSIKESVLSQRNIEAQAEQLNARMRQETAVSNADKVFNLNMTQFNAEQQTELSNKKFLQTVALTDTNNEQQAVMQNAASMASLDLAELDANTKLAAQNAQAFLQMDMVNLSNRQQSEVLRSQQTQQRLLSNQSAANAAAQFNAASENQTNQFMTGLAAQIDMNNAARNDAMSQFNATQQNASEARRAGLQADINKFNAQLVTQVDQFNAQQDFATNQWMAQNSAAVEAANVQWRRQTNTVNTATQNQINMQNAMNAFNLSSQSMSFLWQELRDQADFNFKSFENDENRKAQIIATAIANEGKSGEQYDDYLTSLLSSLSTSYKAGLYGG